MRKNKVIKILIFTFLFTVVLLISLCHVEAKEYPSPKVLHVDGNSLKDSQGHTVRLIGPVTADFGLHDNTWFTSNFSDWYNEESLTSIKSWGCNTFRFAMTVDYYIEHPEQLEIYKKYIDLAISLDMYVIIEWGYCGNPLNVEAYATTFFEALSKHYADNPYVLYEICNEPYNASWEQISFYSNRIIPLIRENAPNSVILVGTPYPSSAYPDTHTSPIKSPLCFDNIVYTIHNYSGDSLSYEDLKYIREYHGANLALDISEYGTTMSTGNDGHYEIPAVVYLKYLDKYNVGWQFFNMSDIRFSKPTYDSSICIPGKWDKKLSDSSLSESGLFIKKYLTSNGQNYNLSNYCIMMNYVENHAFWSPLYKDKITKIVITTSDQKPSTYDISWDVSIDQSGNVMAYLKNDELYIASTSGPVYAPENSDKLFAHFSSLKDIDLQNMNFSLVITMRSFLREAHSLYQVDFSSKSLSQLKDMTCMFADCNNLEIINFSNCNMQKLTSIIRAFQGCSSLYTLQFGNINPNIIESYNKAFADTSQNIMTIQVNNSSDISFFNRICPLSTVIAN